MIDQNRDGFIDAADLKDMFASLGKDVTDDYVEDMLNDANGAINFTMFLTLFSEARWNSLLHGILICTLRGVHHLQAPLLPLRAS